MNPTKTDLTGEGGRAEMIDFIRNTFILVSSPDERANTNKYTTFDVSVTILLVYFLFAILHYIKKWKILN